MLTKRAEPYIFIAPAATVLIVVLAFPLAYAIGLSFMRWDLIRPDLGRGFVGISNYIQVILDDSFIKAVLLTLGFTFILVLSEVIIGMVLALLLQKRVFGRGIFRALLMLPMVVTPVVVGLVFRSLLFNTTFGLINYALSLFKFESITWLSGIWTSRFSVLCGALWGGIPYSTLMLLAGLESLPVEPYEAAMIDGASKLQTYKLITIPLLKHTILVTLIIRTILNIRIFDIPQIMTGGGPGIANQSLSILAYKQSMVFFRMGIGASTSILTLLITTVLAIIFIKSVKSNEDY